MMEEYEVVPESFLDRLEFLESEEIEKSTGKLENLLESNETNLVERLQALVKSRRPFWLFRNRSDLDVLLYKDRAEIRDLIDEQMNLGEGVFNHVWDILRSLNEIRVYVAYVKSKGFCVEERALASVLTDCDCLLKILTLKGSESFFVDRSMGHMEGPWRLLVRSLCWSHSDILKREKDIFLADCRSFNVRMCSCQPTDEWPYRYMLWDRFMKVNDRNM